MLPVIVNTSAFLNFTYITAQRQLKIDGIRQFEAFSSFVEAFVLSDELQYFNVGAFHFEWINGHFVDPGISLPIHPYECFHGLDFIKEAKSHYDEEKRFGDIHENAGDLADEIITVTTSYEENKDVRIDMVSDEEIEAAFSEEGGVPGILRHQLSTYLQAYNGRLGECCPLEPQIFREMLPRLVKYKGIKQCIDSDPTITSAYKKLSQVYDNKIRQCHEDSEMLIIPPITTVLLSRLPDGCTDPFDAMRILLELRDELESLRNKFAELEKRYYDPNSSHKELQDLRSEMFVDSHALAKDMGNPHVDNVAWRYFLDPLLTVARALMRREVPAEELVNLLGDLVPDLAMRLKTKKPSRLHGLAMDSFRLEGIRTLAHRKLSINI